MKKKNIDYRIIIPFFIITIFFASRAGNDREKGRKELEVKLNNIRTSDISKVEILDDSDRNINFVLGKGDLGVGVLLSAIQGQSYGQASHPTSLNSLSFYVNIYTTESETKLYVTVMNNRDIAYISFLNEDGYKYKSEDLFTFLKSNQILK